MHRLPCTFFLVGRLAGQFSGSLLELFRIGTRRDLERFITRRSIPKNKR